MHGTAYYNIRVDSKFIHGFPEKWSRFAEHTSETTALHQSTYRATCLHFPPAFDILLRHLISWSWK